MSKEQLLQELAKAFERLIATATEAARVALPVKETNGDRVRSLPTLQAGGHGNCAYSQDCCRDASS
jgi:hypothetical protein